MAFPPAFERNIATYVFIAIAASSAVVLSASLDAAESVNARLTRKSDRSDNEDKGLSGYIAPLYRKDSAQPLKDVKLGRSTGRPIVPDDIELQFQKTLVKVCKSAFPDIETREPHSTPFRHSNCTVICVYGHPPVQIPDGEMCYLQLNFIGTPGRCENSECVISGPPFEFDVVAQKKPGSRPLQRLAQSLHQHAELQRLPRGIRRTV